MNLQAITKEKVKLVVGGRFPTGFKFSPDSFIVVEYMYTSSKMTNEVHNLVWL